MSTIDPDNTIENSGILAPPSVHYWHNRNAAADMPYKERRPQRCRPHEEPFYYTDARNMTRVINLLAHAEHTKTLSEKHLKEIQYRINVTHPELPFSF